MNNLNEKYSMVFFIPIVIVQFFLSQNLKAENHTSLMSPDVLNVQTISRCIPAENCTAYDINLYATVNACANPSSLNWKYLIKNYENDEIIQYSYNIIPAPNSGVQGDKNLDFLDHTMNAQLTVLDTLSIGKYYVEWTVIDSQGYSYKGTQFFNIYDSEPPVLNIYHIKEIYTLDKIYAISFDRGYEYNSITSYDNCKASSELYFTLSAVLPNLEENQEKWAAQLNKYGHYYYDAETGLISTESKYYLGEAYGWDPVLKSSFSPMDAICKKIYDALYYTNSPYYLKIYAWDNFDPSNQCRLNNYSVDSVFLSTFCDAEFSILSTGKVLTLDEKPVNNMNVLSDDGEFILNSLTDSQGNYEIKYTENIQSGFKLSAYKNSDFKKGISTSDILLIRKHILGLEQFDSPYKAIAADINGDNKVSASDIIQLINLILGKKDDFDNVSYLGILQNYNFENPNLAYNETQNASVKKFENNSSTPHEIDFWAIKIGDVNQSLLSLNPRNFSTSKIFIKDKEVNPGQELINVPIYFDNVKSLQGFQLAFDLQGLDFWDIKSDILDINTNNYNIKDGKLLMSVDASTINKLDINSKTPLFELLLTTTQTGKLSQMIKLDNNELAGELYTGNNLNINNIELEYRNSKNTFNLLQNYPNPITNETTISFVLEKEQQYKFEIFDFKGKIIYSSLNSGKKGINNIKLDINDLSQTYNFRVSNKSGIYFYRIVTDNNTATKKMIVIDS